MPTKSITIPEPLSQYLSANKSDELPSIAAYVDRGAELVSGEALLALRGLRAPLRAKIATLGESELLRRRLELLAAYFDETSQGPVESPVQRDVAFALFYFLKGFDRIPDTVPDIGLLDDALVVQTVLQRHSIALRAHWLRNRRVWPQDL